MPVHDPHHALRRFADQLRSLDIELPERAAGVLAVMDHLAHIVFDDPTAELHRRLLDGDLDPTTAHAMVMTAARQLTARQTAGDIVRGLQSTYRKAAGRAVGGNGDLLVGQLADRFAASYAAMVAAPFAPGTPLETIVAAGSKATAAYTAMPGHRSTLDACFEVRRMLCEFGYGDPRRMPHAALVLDIADAPHLPKVGVSLSEQTDEPGGRWHRIAAAGIALRVNTYGEAVAVADAASAAEEAAEAARRHRPLTPAEQSRSETSRRLAELHQKALA